MTGRRSHVLTALVATLLCTTPGCGSGGETLVLQPPAANEAPSVAVTSPAMPLTVSHGGTFEVGYTDDDPDDVATTSVLLDPDGDPATASGQHVLVADRLELDGTPQSVSLRWNPADVPPGSYRILAQTSDGNNPPAVALAAGIVTLADVSRAKRAGGSSFTQALAVAAFPDGSSVVTGSFVGSATFGPGEASETTLTADGSTDVFVARYAAGGTLVWAKRAGGTLEDQGLAVAALPDGSAIVAGSFSGSATFGAGEPLATPLVSAGGEDAFVARFHLDGALAWAKRAGGAAADRAAGIGALTNGEFVAAGAFEGTAVFGEGEPGATSLVAAGGVAVFVARYGADGALTWAKRAGGVSYAQGLAVAVAPDGSCLATGEFTDAATFGPGEAAETTLSSPGTLAVFLARFAADGVLLWAEQSEDADFARGAAVAALPDGSALLTGSYLGEATFGRGDGTETTLDPEGSEDAFVARYGPDGTLAWARRAAGPAVDQALAIAALADGSAVVAGRFGGAMTLGLHEAGETTLTPTGAVEAFVARYAPHGEVVWARRFACSVSVAAHGVATLPDGSVWAVGAFAGTATFGPGEPGERTLTAAGASNAFVTRVNADGSF